MTTLVATLASLAPLAPTHGVARAQAALGAITGTTSYGGRVAGYVAILDLASARFTPVVAALSDSCRAAGSGQVSLLPTGDFAAAHRTLLAITANAGPGLSRFVRGACGVPSGLIVSDGLLVNPGETHGPVLAFTDRTRAEITDDTVPAATRWAVAGTTVTNNDCADLHRIGTLLVRRGVPGACPIPKARIAAGRTAVGVDTSGTMLIVAVVEGSDGSGVRTRDMAELMIALGAADAVNLDGGGSTTFYWTPDVSGAPAASARAARMIAAARFPSTDPNPGAFTFSTSPLDVTRPLRVDAAHRPIYASFGVVLAP